MDPRLFKPVAVSDVEFGGRENLWSRSTCSLLQRVSKFDGVFFFIENLEIGRETWYKVGTAVYASTTS